MSLYTFSISTYHHFTELIECMYIYKFMFKNCKSCNVYGFKHVTSNLCIESHVYTADLSALEFDSQAMCVLRSPVEKVGSAHFHWEKWSPIAVCQMSPVFPLESV